MYSFFFLNITNLTSVMLATEHVTFTNTSEDKMTVISSPHTLYVLPPRGDRKCKYHIAKSICSAVQALSAATVET